MGQNPPPEAPRIVLQSAPRASLGKEYDPEPEREQVRGKIAVWLLGILTGVVALAFIDLMGKWVAIGDLRTLLEIVFGPIISLTGAVVGFYFGGKSKA